MTTQPPAQELPELPKNVQHIMRRIRACEGEEAARIVLEHALREYGRACIAASQAGRAEAGMSTLTEVEAYKIFLFASLKKDCERPNGITAGKKIKYSVADNLLLLSVRYPSLAEAMK